MNKRFFFFMMIAIGWSCQNEGGTSSEEASKIPSITVEYPNTFRDTALLDTFFGSRVKDPYRWLENEQSESTRRWVSTQQSLTEKYLNQLPDRELIRQRLEKLWDYERFSNPEKKGNYFYQFRNSGLQNQSVLYRSQSLTGSWAPILDPNTFSLDGTAALGGYAFSKDGSLLAYEVSEGGSDWHSIYIKDMESGQVLKDTIQWIKFSNIAWFRDGFFYSRYPQPSKGAGLEGKNEFHQVYYHKVGTSQAEDELVFADRVHPQRNFYAQVSPDEKFLLVSGAESTSGNALYFRDLTTDEIALTPIVESFDYDFVPVGSDKNNLYVLTNFKASNKRLVRINASQPDARFWQEVIPENGDVLEQVYMYGGKLLALYIHNAQSLLKVLDLNGQEQGTVNLPDIGTVTEIKGDIERTQAFFEFTSLTRPPGVYELDLKTLQTKIYKEPKVDFDSDAYETKQVWFESYDGTRVPLFVVHKKGLNMDGQRPTLLFGYGGFNIPMMPIFNRTRINLFPVILENDGVCAVANIRGGGEFGTAWHLAGTKNKKQNVFDDFQSAAEYLIANKYTSADKLAIYGRSNGGLLVGACLTQRPDLFRVAIPAVGVLDMMRYHQFTIGWAWATDYGRSDVKEDFDYLLAYSPLHNVSREKYPATLITTADHDDRVVPAHSYKFAAALQYNQIGDSPILVRIDSSAGHGAGKPTSKSIAEGADVLAFIFQNMGIPVVYRQQK
ncbi:MAG TPA: prolyl oligopeptidase family serine peptidase [Saprospiraceae bacterium]|nr:prolyl oligopeptidase family serine peptidase [Saprospiraceae bacterium]HMQ82114.1 prolyl oligopeptidase family serine peptidase [Saprospiraceae bacterium]